MCRGVSRGRRGSKSHALWQRRVQRCNVQRFFFFMRFFKFVFGFCILSVYFYFFICYFYMFIFFQLFSCIFMFLNHSFNFIYIYIYFVYFFLFFLIYVNAKSKQSQSKLVCLLRVCLDRCLYIDRTHSAHTHTHTLGIQLRIFLTGSRWGRWGLRGTTEGHRLLANSLKYQRAHRVSTV